MSKELDRSDPDYGFTFRIHTRTRTDYDSSGVQEQDELETVESGSD